MVGTSQKLIIITRLDLNNKQDGHVIYFIDFIEDLLGLRHFNEIAIWSPFKIKPPLEGIVVYDDMPKRELGLIKSVTRHNLYKKRIKDYDVVQQWYLPKFTIWQMISTKHSKSVVIFPDSWYSYFKSKYYVEKNWMDVGRLLYYWLIEKAAKRFGKSVLISEPEADFHNGVHLPHKIINEVLKTSNKMRDVFIGRMSDKYLLEIIDNVVSKMPDINFEILTDSNKIIEVSKNYSNITTMVFLDNYQSYTSAFMVNLIFDAYSSGMSTKFVNGLNTNTPILGNQNVFRGFNNLVVPDLCIYNTWGECRNRLYTITRENVVGSRDVYNDFYHKLRSNYGGKYRTKQLKKIYDIE